MSRCRHLAAVIAVALGFFGFSAPSQAVPVSGVAPLELAARSEATVEKAWGRRYRGYYKRHYYRPYRRYYRRRYYYPRYYRPYRRYYKRRYYYPRYRRYYRRYRW